MRTNASVGLQLVLTHVVQMATESRYRTTDCGASRQAIKPSRLPPSSLCKSVADITARSAADNIGAIHQTNRCLSQSVNYASPMSVSFVRQLQQQYANSKSTGANNVANVLTQFELIMATRQDNRVRERWTKRDWSAAEEELSMMTMTWFKR